METLALSVPKPLPSPENTYRLRHSTPVSSPCLRGGTNCAYECFQTDISESNEQHSRSEMSKTFELFLTNIDKYVTENEISLMVSRCLGINSTNIFDVKKLVSNSRDFCKLDYVSFKIALDEHQRTLAMNESTWPKGVKFREFVNRHSNTWKP